MYECVYIYMYIWNEVTQLGMIMAPFKSHRMIKKTQVPGMETFLELLVMGIQETVK